ncbi:MAG: methyltransferase domain-containing protein [Planctomycetota bacterium]
MKIKSANAPLDACAVCGGEEFTLTPVVWDGLAQQWGLSEAQRHQIDRQQGERCASCGCSRRSIALARAVLAGIGRQGETLREVARRPPEARVLEINEAGELTRWLSRFPGHTLVRYPDEDMTSLSFDDGSFDLVVHGDTLEHVPDAVAGLRECRRVLAPGGACCYTVPVLTDRLTRSRDGLEPSYHGPPDDPRQDYQVQWEFGSDAWVWPLRAGFSTVSLHAGSSLDATTGEPCAYGIRAEF